jgi:hypothetical protein
MCDQDFPTGSLVTFFTYKNGERSGERESEDPKDQFKRGGPDEHYRYSLRLDVAEAVEQGTEALLALIESNPVALRFIPEALKTVEFYRAVVQ